MFLSSIKQKKSQISPRKIPKSKMEIGMKDLDFLGLKIQSRKIMPQHHFFPKKSKIFQKN